MKQAREQAPILVAIGNRRFMSIRMDRRIAHQLLEHPALKSLLVSRLNGKKRDSIIIPSNLWNCGGPFIVEAVEKLARKRKALTKTEARP